MWCDDDNEATSDFIKINKLFSSTYMFFIILRAAGINLHNFSVTAHIGIS